MGWSICAKSSLLFGKSIFDTYHGRSGWIIYPTGDGCQPGQPCEPLKTCIYTAFRVDLFKMTLHCVLTRCNPHPETIPTSYIYSRDTNRLKVYFLCFPQKSKYTLTVCRYILERISFLLSFEVISNLF